MNQVEHLNWKNQMTSVHQIFRNSNGKLSTFLHPNNVTSPQLNQVNTPIQNNQISPVPPSFEVSQTPLENFPICGTPSILMFAGFTSPQLNQVNTPIRTGKINSIPPNFEVFRTPLANSPISGTLVIEMS